MARVSVSNEFFRQKARRQSTNDDSDKAQEETEVKQLKAQVDQMEATIRESEKRNTLLVKEIEALKEEFSAKSENSLVLSKLMEVEEAFFQKCEETAHAISELRKEANLPTNDKSEQISNLSEKPAQVPSLGIPWGAVNTRPWSSESESTALSIKESSLRKRLAPELGTKISIFEDFPDSTSGRKQDPDHSFELIDAKLTSPLAKNSSPSPLNNLENIPELNAPHTRTRSKSPPNAVKKEPVRRTRRRPRKALSNITSRNNEESDDDNAIFDFVEQDDLIEQTARRSKRRRAN